MHKTSVFVSSTCYDLKALREHLRLSVEGLGHTAILSEYPSFPVSPDLSTIENCKKVVREHADLFVLIVGGKRGSLDGSTQRSVVNTEYREAKRIGLDCFVFVDRQVWDLLPHHKKNQNVDFSPTVDSSEVFDFIDELVQDNRWIFQFQRTEEIAEILRTQLSARFHDLLTRAYTKRLDVPTGFEGESEQVIDFVVNGGDLWEYRLANALLKERLSKIDAKFIDVARGFVFRRSRFLSPRDTMPYIQDLLTDITGLLSAAGKVLNEEIVPGFGPPGVAGDAEQIKRGCDNLYSLFLELYEWELDVRFVRSHEIFSELFKTMHGWPDELLSEFRRLTRELADLLSSPNLSGQYTIDLVFHAPSGLANFSEGLEKLTNDPRLISLMAEEI